MKKILLSIVLLMATFLLVACGDKYDPEYFRDKDVVEMSNEEVSALLSEVDWEAVGEAMMLSANADIYFSSNSLPASENQRDMTLDVVFNTASYFLDSETVGEALVHSASDVEFSYTLDETLTILNEPISKDISGNGSLDVYFVDGFLYVNPNVAVTNDGTDVTVSGKEKLNEEVTQTMWDEYRSGADLESMGQFTNMPNTLLDLLAWENLEGILEAFPAVTVYERSSVTNVHIEINKELVTANLEDLLWAVYNMAVDSGSTEVPTVAEATEQIDDMVTIADEYLDYFTELEFTLDIIIEDNQLASLSLGTSVLSNDDFTTNTGKSIDITLAVVLNRNAELPNFPSDLNDYTGVDDIGSGYLNLFN